MFNFKRYSNVTKIVVPDKVQWDSASIADRFSGLTNLRTIQLNLSNTTNMWNAFTYCSNLTTAICGDNVQDMSSAYRNCRKLTTAVCGNNVQDMWNTYSYCTNLTKAVCGPNVTNMQYTYLGCNKLTTAVSGPNVIDMRYTYRSCTNLTTAACGDKVQLMTETYYGCTNLTTAVCGNNVANMYWTYRDCTSLTRAVCGSNVFNMTGAYRYCPNIQGNAYFYSPRINDCSFCFANRNTSNRLNIYVPENTTSNASVHSIGTYSIVGNSITWDTDTANKCSYNTAYNIYIYPVANVENARIANGDPNNMGVM